MGRRKQGTLQCCLCSVSQVAVLFCDFTPLFTYFVQITYFIVLKTEFNMLPLNMFSLGLSILENNSPYHTGA